MPRKSRCGPLHFISCRNSETDCLMKERPSHRAEPDRPGSSLRTGAEGSGNATRKRQTPDFQHRQTRPWLSAALHVESQETAAGGQSGTDQSWPRQAPELRAIHFRFAHDCVTVGRPLFCGLTRRARNDFLSRDPEPAAPVNALLRSANGMKERQTLRCSFLRSCGFALRIPSKYKACSCVIPPHHRHPLRRTPG